MSYASQAPSVWGKLIAVLLHIRQHPPHSADKASVPNPTRATCRQREMAIRNAELDKLRALQRSVPRQMSPRHL